MDANRSTGLIRVNPPKKSELRTIRVLIACGLVSMACFMAWFINPAHAGYAPIFWLLTLALAFKLVKMVHEWYHYWSPSVPVMPQSTRKWKVDLLTTACPGEPKSMIIRTLKAMQAVTYPHTSYLCDEGDDPELKQACAELGVVHVTREKKTDAKAGNINNALRQATGEICVVLDPDHVPVPEFLDRVLPYFEDERVGFVQCVQAYGNQSESFIARGAAEQTYHFYGPMMMSMNTYGTAQAIGANCTFRRSALDSIGGHAAGLSEDMHTAMQLHAKGWKSVYIPEILTRGLVPATLSSYYKQQLKWSRGTFELLFRTYPKLARHFTWRQKLHYATLPLYFLFGLINLIDILIPLAALYLAQVPWEVDLGRFAAGFLPMVGFSLVIRFYAQRWLLEPHERGFHLAGGILRTATWWIFLIGFIYTIFKIKVPYIPTPKEDEHSNYLRLSMPNVVVVAVCLLVTAYGLSIDWTPYSLAMASYALLNAGMLGLVALLSQQRTLYRLRSLLGRYSLFILLARGAGRWADGSQQVIYGMLRNGPAALLAGFSLVFLSYGSISDEEESYRALRPKELGGFYTGVAGGSEGHRPQVAGNFNEIVTLNTPWDTLPGHFLPDALQQAKASGSMALLNWTVKDSANSGLFQQVTAGTYDEYLRRCASALISYAEPVLISFCPFADGTSGGDAKGDEFAAAWQYLYTFFTNSGVSNLTWVWQPARPSSGSYYPGPKFVDWIGVSCLNYGEDRRDNDWYTFTQIYKPFHDALGPYGKPVIITEFGSARGPDQALWFEEGLGAISADFNEIHGLVIFDREKEIMLSKEGKDERYIASFVTAEPALRQLAAFLSSPPFSSEPFTAAPPVGLADRGVGRRSGSISGGPGSYIFMAGNKPYYIRGVSYNTQHDWRDGNMPLTRRQLEKDFANIRAMGANTIRRYDHGIYDRNILNIAREFNLKVLYGFWFDPKVDYYKDSVRVQQYMEELEEQVMKYRDHPAVLAWSVGNETWGLLKHRYAKPYLCKVRAAYVRMIELMARRIHELDPSRAVFSCMEHEEYQLPGELVAFREGAPSVDVIGVNSYYREQISRLNHLAWRFDSLRPYLVSEFGPRGYWDPSYNRTANGSLIEDSEKEKAQWYADQWRSYVQPYKGYNIGGFAYCWHDRMEGSYTWFGLTDYRSRLKPSYHALRKLWTGEGVEPLPTFTIVAPSVLTPGSDYHFTAVTDGPPRELNYEWRLLKNEYLDEIEGIEQDEAGNTIRLKIPEEPSDYRLYLFASDEHGNVTTASVPVPVRH